jgi:predicted ATPase
MLAVVYNARGDLAAMQEWVAATIRQARERQHVYWGLLGEILDGWLCAQREKTAAAAAIIADRLDRYTKNGTRLGLSWLLLLQAEAYGYAGKLDQALETVAIALQHAEQTGEAYYLAEVYRRKGELLLARSGQSSRPDAEACYRQALHLARAQAAKAWELRAAMSLARLLASQGQRRPAREVLVPVYESFTEGHTTCDLSEASHLVLELAG